MFDVATIFRLITLVPQLAAEAKSDHDLATKIKTVAGAAWPELEPFIKDLFPGVQPALLPAAGSLLVDHTRVKRIQEALNARGAHLDADGWYGDLSKAAVREFQKANGLTVDGWAGKNTQDALGIGD